MRARAHARLVSLAALLPLLIVALSGFGYDRMRCTFSGAVSEDGCCPAEDAPATPVANGASCCDRESARTVEAPAEVAPPTFFAVEALASLSAPVTLAPPTTRATLAPRTAAQSPPPTPLILVKQSFLI